MKCLRKIDAKSLLQMGRFLEDTQNIVFGGLSIDSLLFHNKSFIELLDDLKVNFCQTALKARAVTIEILAHIQPIFSLPMCTNLFLFQ